MSGPTYQPGVTTLGEFRVIVDAAAQLEQFAPAKATLTLVETQPCQHPWAAVDVQLKLHRMADGHRRLTITYQCLDCDQVLNIVRRRILGGGK